MAWLVVVHKWPEVVLVHKKVCRDEVYRNADILVSFHGRAKVEVFDVDAHEFCIGGGNNTVDEDLLACSEVGGGCADIALFALDAASTHGEANAFGLGFVGPEGGNDA